MKLDKFVPFGRPQCGSAIMQLMTELDNTETAIPKPINGLNFTTKKSHVKMLIF